MNEGCKLFKGDFVGGLKTYKPCPGKHNPLHMRLDTIGLCFTSLTSPRCYDENLICMTNTRVALAGIFFFSVCAISRNSEILWIENSERQMVCFVLWSRNAGFKIPFRILLIQATSIWYIEIKATELLRPWGQQLFCWLICWLIIWLNGLIKLRIAQNYPKALQLETV